MENKLITEIFPGVSKKKIKIILASLSIAMQDAIYTKYGKNFDKCEKCISEQDKFMVKKALYRINIYLEKEKAYHHISAKQLKEAFPKLKEENKKVIVHAYGEKLNKFNDLQVYNFSKLEDAMKDVVRNSTKVVADSNKEYPVMEEFYSKYPAMYVDKAISLLDRENKEIVKRIEKGELQLDKNVPFTLISTVTRLLERMYINWGENYYSDIRKELNVSPDKLTREAIDDVIDNEIDIKSKSLIDKIRNREELTTGEKAKYGKIIKMISNRLRQVSYVETIYALNSGYTKEEVNEAIEMLSDMYKNKIYFRYGFNLENPVRGEGYTKEDGESFMRELLLLLI